MPTQKPKSDVFDQPALSLSNLISTGSLSPPPIIHKSHTIHKTRFQKQTQNLRKILTFELGIFQDLGWEQLVWFWFWSSRPTFRISKPPTSKSNQPKTSPRWDTLQESIRHLESGFYGDGEEIGEREENLLRRGAHSGLGIMSNLSLPPTRPPLPTQKYGQL